MIPEPTPSNTLGEDPFYAMRFLAGKPYVKDPFQSNMEPITIVLLQLVVDLASCGVFLDRYGFPPLISEIVPQEGFYGR
jgi:hypothetical protein